ncbi:MAG: hypothetical protein EOO99_12200 [Pedobacter sp.]|nr:MAG: hypothetical protein EOO99_12200 [Pedobacter sp.]
MFNNAIQIFLIFTIATTYSQNTAGALKIIETSERSCSILDFDYDGKPLNMTCQDQNGKNYLSLNFVYKNGLLQKIYSERNGNYYQADTTTFVYDRNKLVTQIKNHDTTKFTYDQFDRIEKIINVYRNEVVRKYDDLNRLVGEVSTRYDEEVPDTFETISYRNNVIIKSQDYHSVCGVSNQTVYLEYRDGNLMRKTITNNKSTNSSSSEYQYSSEGLLKDEVHSYSSSSYNILIKAPDLILNHNYIKKINKILIGDFSEINWY